MIVSIIIPCRNEERFIAKCLDSVINQTYQKEKIDVLVVDGNSEDRTKEIVNRSIQKYNFIKILDNSKKIFSAACNIGVKNSKGDLIIILSAHAVYPEDYIEKCVYYSEKYNADNVGGDVQPVSLKNNIISSAIVLSFGGWFGKINNKKNELPKEADTVFGGCYKKEVFERIGFFNENLERTSDLEFNIRLKRSGGKIMFIPSIISYYYPKNNLRDFFIHNIHDGVWNILPFKFTKKPLKFRHYLPLIFILTLPINIWIYFPISIFFSAKISLFKKDIRYLFIMPTVFLNKHIGHGIGSFFGLLRLIL
ncbi:glycosyltransferase family 2 protein [Patescibacteria group bacterium]|nr:glycosyltransferase family 2 protein [Patescibacteria group bacterium]